MFDGAQATTLARIADTFHRSFARRYKVRLICGADEPLYLPADADCADSRIYSRADYPASALHEIAHWCIAGERRRQLEDYGYWYSGDGRGAEQQRAFQQVEVKPQALEWAFSRACGLRFRVSIDNLDGEPVDPYPFQRAVWQQACSYHRDGLPARAGVFEAALREAFGTDCVEPALAELVH